MRPGLWVQDADAIQQLTMRRICAGLQLDGGSEAPTWEMRGCNTHATQMWAFLCSSLVVVVARHGGRQPQDSAALAAHVVGGQARVATYRYASVGAALSVAERIAVVVPRIRTCPQIAPIGMS